MNIYTATKIDELAIESLSPLKPDAKVEGAKPFVKWAGGKNQLLEQYQPYFPPTFNRYFEPFLGGGAVFFHLQPAVARLGDVNPDLIHAYRVVRDQVEDLIALLLDYQEKHSEDFFYEMRASNPVDRLERAARLIYTTKTSFNGLLRYNKSGGLNAPIGRQKRGGPRVCDPDILRADAIALRSTLLAAEPFEAVLKFAKAGDFLYFDPPYSPLSSTSNFTAYTKDSFTDADQVRLRDVCSKLAKRGCFVMIANSDCKFVRKLYSRRKYFRLNQVMAMRSMNCKTDRRGKIPELVITNYDPQALHDELCLNPTPCGLF